MKAKTAIASTGTQHRRRVTEDVRGLMVDLERIASARYGTGLVPQQDVVKAQTEVTAMRTELLMLNSERRQASAPEWRAGATGRCPFADAETVREYRPRHWTSPR
jgi:hypothetical protein